MYSAYLYLAMSNYLDCEGYPGMASWYFVQYREESDHALYMYKYATTEGARLAFDAIDKPDTDFKGVKDVMDRTLAHELKVTGLINNIAAACLEEKDFRTMNFMNWFIKEQSEEESNCNDNLAKLRMMGEAGVYQLDNEMGTRVYAASANPPIIL